MDKVEFVIINLPEGDKEYAIIDRGNGEFTSMPKSTYDTLASESNPTGGNN